MNLDKTQEASDQLDLARAAFDAHMPEQAQLHLRRVLDLDPANPIARLLEARLRLMQNQPGQALSALDSHDLYHPDSRGQPAVAMLRVQGLVRSGMNDLALPLLEKLRAEFPDDARAHRMMASVCVGLGQHARAIEALRQVVRLEPDDRPARMTLARLLGENDPDAAIELLRGPECANDLMARVRLARLYHQAGRDREAEALYTSLLTEAPNEAVAWREAGLLADSLGEHSQAVQRLREALKRGGGESETLAELAIVHMHSGEIFAAARCWWRVARSNASATRAWAGLLVCALAAGRSRLVRRLQKTLTVQTSKRERQQMLAELWQHLAGGLVIKRALVPEAEPAPVESPLTQLLSRAERVLESHAAEHPRRADTQYHLATCRNGLDDEEGAIAAVEAALAVNPDYAAAVKLKAQLRQAA